MKKKMIAAAKQGIMCILALCVVWCVGGTHVFAQDDDAKVKAEEEVSAVLAGQIKSAVSQARAGKFKEASDTLDALVSLPNGGYLAAYNLGVVQEMQGKDATAMQSYLKALATNNSFSPALFNACKIHLKGNRVEDARRLAEKYIAKRPQSLGHRVVMLEIMLAQGRYEDVARQAKDVLRKDERHVDAMIALADANYQLKRYELARTVIAQAEKISKGRADLQYRLGLVNLKLEEKGLAILNFKKAVKLRDQYPEAHNNLGLLYHEARDYQNALMQFDAAIRDAPNFKQAHLNRGNALKGLKKFKAALNAFKKGIELDANYGAAYFNLAVIYLDSPIPGMELIPRYQKAIETFKKYQSVMGSKLGRKDPSTKYVAEATKGIKDEKDRQELMRQTPMDGE